MALVSLTVLTACQVSAPPTPTPTSNSPSAAAARPRVAPSPSATTSSAAPPSPSPVVAAPKPSAAASPAAVQVAPPATGARRVEVLNAANAALQRGDAAGASGLYERVTNTPPSGESAEQAAAIDQFAHFEAIVAFLSTGNETQAKAHLDALQKAAPNSPFARLASQVWDQYGMVGSLRGACAQVQPQIASQAGPTLQALQAAGASVDPQSLCRTST